ncbi:MAG: PIN domain-containing protein [archaeon]|nr:PIN domain-containing protein [archaeon]
MKILFDTSALIAFANKEKPAKKIKEIVQAVEKGKINGIISGITLTEIIYIVGRKSEQKAFNIIAFVEESRLEIIGCTKDLFVAAGHIKMKYKEKNLSIADCIIIATAVNEKADEVLSLDRGWQGIKEIKLAEI